jgi:hypothetical protein
MAYPAKGAFEPAKQELDDWDAMASSTGMLGAAKRPARLLAHTTARSWLAGEGYL